MEDEKKEADGMIRSQLQRPVVIMADSPLPVQAPASSKRNREDNAADEPEIKTRAVAADDDPFADVDMQQESPVIEAADDMVLGMLSHIARVR